MTPAERYRDERRKADAAFASAGAACVRHAAAAYRALCEYAREHGITTDEAAERIRAEARKGGAA